MCDTKVKTFDCTVCGHSVTLEVSSHVTEVPCDRCRTACDTPVARGWPTVGTFGVRGFSS